MLNETALLVALDPFPKRTLTSYPNFATVDTEILTLFSLIILTCCELLLHFLVSVVGSMNRYVVDSPLAVIAWVPNTDKGEKTRESSRA